MERILFKNSMPQNSMKQLAKILPGEFQMESYGSSSGCLGMHVENWGMVFAPTPETLPLKGAKFTLDLVSGDGATSLHCDLKVPSYEFFFPPPPSTSTHTNSY